MEIPYFLHRFTMASIVWGCFERMGSITKVLKGQGFQGTWASATAATLPTTYRMLSTTMSCFYFCSDMAVCQNLVPLVNSPKNGINRYWSIPIYVSLQWILNRHYAMLYISELPALALTKLSVFQLTSRLSVHVETPSYSLEDHLVNSSISGWRVYRSSIFWNINQIIKAAGISHAASKHSQFQTQRRRTDIFISKSGSKISPWSQLHGFSRDRIHPKSIKLKSSCSQIQCHQITSALSPFKPPNML